MSEEQKIHMKFEREDVPTTSVRKRWAYWLFIKHIKFTAIIILLIISSFGASFPFAIFVLEWHWACGLLGPFIFIGFILYWIGVGFLFITVRAWPAYFASIPIYILISYFIQAERVGLRELGSKKTYFFNITTTSDGYLLHEGKMFGLLKKPIYLDKMTVKYFKENGVERVSIEKGRKDETYLEVDIVPLSWRGDSLLITDDETKKEFINNSILVTEHIRDYYSLVVKGFNPSDREVEKGIIYDKILGTAEYKKQILQLKREVKEMDIDHIEKIAEVLIPHHSDELRRFKHILKEATKPYDKVSERIEKRTAKLDLVKQKAKNSELTIEELTNLVAIEELD